jgi:hypothetical protein
MHILLTKISGEKHSVKIVRNDRSVESLELVTREALCHDLLHYAVESALPTQGGFWGTLASGKTFSDLNDRTGQSTRENAATLYLVEGIVGVMSGITEMPVQQAFKKLCWYSESQGQELPGWCSPEFVGDVLERMRRLQGRWRATPFGESMTITWDEPTPD